MDGAVFQNTDYVLDAAAVLALDVDAGLHGDYVAGAEQLGGGGRAGEAGGFVDVETHAVTQTVAEETLVACVVNDVTGHLVGLEAGHTHLQVVDGGGLGVENGVVDLLDLLVGLSDDHGSGHIGAVAVHLSAEVHGEEALLQLYGTGSAVGTGRLSAGHGDDVKGNAL